jgi:hypothetical protein
MKDNKNIRVELETGIVLKIPRDPVVKITVPSVPVGRTGFKRVVMHVRGRDIIQSRKRRG